MYQLPIEIIHMIHKYSHYSPCLRETSKYASSVLLTPTGTTKMISVVYVAGYTSLDYTKWYLNRYKFSRHVDYPSVYPLGELISCNTYLCEYAAAAGNLINTMYLYYHEATPMVSAIAFRQIEVAEWLHSSLGRLATYAAAPDGDMEMLSVARRYGAKMDAQTMIMCAWKNRITTMKWLHSQGCSWPCDIVPILLRKGDLVNAKYVIENGCPVHHSQSLAGYMMGPLAPTLDTIQYLLNAGAYIDGKVFKAAAMCGNIAGIKLLVSMGNGDGIPNTVTNVAADNEQWEMLRYLVCDLKLRPMFRSYIFNDDKMCVKIREVIGYDREMELLVDDSDDRSHHAYDDSDDDPYHSDDDSYHSDDDPDDDPDDDSYHSDDDPDDD